MQSKDSDKLLGRFRGWTSGDEEPESPASRPGEEPQNMAKETYRHGKSAGEAAKDGADARQTKDRDEEMDTHNDSRDDDSDIVKLMRNIANGGGKGQDAGDADSGASEAGGNPVDDEDAVSVDTEMDTSPDDDLEDEREKAEVFVLPSIEDRLAGIAALASEKSVKSVVEDEPVEKAPAVAEPSENLYGMLASLKSDIDDLKREQNMRAIPKGEDDLRALLADLKSDIAVLKRGPATPAAPVAPAGESEIRSLLADLKGDIDALKHEAAAPDAPSGEGEMRRLLAELKGDIDGLKREQTLQATPSGEGEMRGLLAALKGDIDALKHEQVIDALPPQEREMRGLLAALKGDINALKREQDEHHGLSPEEREMRALLSALKGDIGELKREQEAQTLLTEERQLRGMLAELKGDIGALKAEQAAAPVIAAQSLTPVSRWGDRLVTAGVVLAVIAIAVGGYYFGARQAASPQGQAVALAPATTKPAGLMAPPATVSAFSISGVSGQPIALKIDTSKANATPDSAVFISGLPGGATLSAARRIADGQWKLSPSDMLGLTLTLPQGYNGRFEAGVSVRSADGAALADAAFQVAATAPAPTVAAPAPAVTTTVQPLAEPAPALPSSVETIGSAEERELIERAQGLMDQGDIASARIVLDYAVSQGGAVAAFRLAQTYDPKSLARMKSVLGVAPDMTKAKTLYYFAARSGHEGAKARLAEIRQGQ